MEAPCCCGTRKRIWPVEIVFFRNSQPVEVPEKMCDVVVLLCVTDQTCHSIKHRLQMVQPVMGKTSQSRTAIIKSRHDQWRDQCAL